MLKALRRIVQEVNAAKDLNDALQIVVHQIKEAMHVQACTVYLVDKRHGEIVLMATDGLNIDAVRKVRVKLTEGLVGLVGQKEEPINLEDQHAHPNYYHHPAAGEESFRAFLGTPIIHQRQLLGVITVQEQENRLFDESEEAFLITLSAQLAGVIAHAQATGEISRLAALSDVDDRYIETTLVGLPSVPGVAIGKVVVVYPKADLDAVPDRKIEDIESEKKVLEEALDITKEEITKLKERLKQSLPPEEIALFDVYLRIIDSGSLHKEVIQEIDSGKWVQAALRDVVKRHVKTFEDMEDKYLSERAADFRDLGQRILSHLQASSHAATTYHEQSILLGDEVTAAALAEAPEGSLAGVVSAKGSTSSHVAILARALGVPTVMGVEGLNPGELEGNDVIVDGYNGRVYLTPSSRLLQEFNDLAEEERELDASLEELRYLPAETPDGHTLSLQVNTGLAIDASLPLSVGAEGVGLYRTEIPFMTRDRFPAEEEQRVIYAQLLKAFSPRPVTMRTLDIGGDKNLSYFPIKDENPFLGWRGIRVTLDHPEIFLVQLRAMLRASMGLDNLRIMLPMISGITELKESLGLIEKAYAELIEEGFEIKKPPIGVMIEVPSAVYQAHEFAKYVDFLSVGSNDLTQYIIAVDRNNSRVASLYDGLHPAVLRALLQVSEGAHSENKPVSLCGELASDPLAVVLLLAMGFDMLSMSSASLPRMKWVIRNFSMKRARELLKEAIVMQETSLIRNYLEQAMVQAGLGGLIRAGKH